MKKIEVFNSGTLGFGDLLNKLSFLFRKYQDDEVEFLIHDKLKVFNTFLFLKNFCFEESKNKKILTQSEHFLRSNTKFELSNHQYWPAKEEWIPNVNGKIAINFYTEMNSPLFSGRSLEIANCKIFPDAMDIKERYDTVELYAIDNYRGHKKIILDKFKCLEENMNILKKCSLFVTSEGGMAHLSRSMSVPTILFFKKDRFNFHSFLNTLIDEKIQKIVHTKTELIERIEKHKTYS